MPDGTTLSSLPLHPKVLKLSKNIYKVGATPLNSFWYLEEDFENEC